MCRMCEKREDMEAHIVSESKKLVQKEYKNWHHDRVTLIIYWELYKNMMEKWYEDKAEKVIETDKVKILSDLQIETHKFETRHSGA